jgi:AcrR family transcriptional regulator
MSVRVARRRAAVHKDSRAAVLDAAVEVLVADPSASLSEVAEAAGIGRTTLHKHFATRDDLLRAVAHRSIDRWEQVMAAAIAASADADDGGLRALAEAMISVGAHLAFLWRNPLFDRTADVGKRWKSVEPMALIVLERAQAAGHVRAGVPGYWLLHTFQAMVYVAAESIYDGDLAPNAAPDLVVATFLAGVGPVP